MNPTWPTEWQLLMPRVVRDWMLYSGKTPPAKWRAELESRLLTEFIRPDGLLDRHDRDVIDWPYNERDDYDFGPANLLPNCYLYDALLAMEELYGGGEYQKRAERLRKVIRDKILIDGSFVDRPDSSHTALHSMIFPVRFGLASPEELVNWQSSVIPKGMACSVYGAQFLLECCYSNGLALHALESMISENLRSWLNMLAKGSTITMEAWDDTLKPNQDWNHAWGTAPGNIIPRWLVGIRPLIPGFRRFIVDPHPVGLEYFSLRHPAPLGAIELAGTPEHLHLKVPDGSIAVVADSEYAAGCHKIRC